MKSCKRPSFSHSFLCGSQSAILFTSVCKPLLLCLQRKESLFLLCFSYKKEIDSFHSANASPGLSHRSVGLGNSKRIKPLSLSPKLMDSVFSVGKPRTSQLKYDFVSKAWTDPCFWNPHEERSSRAFNQRNRTFNIPL